MMSGWLWSLTPIYWVAAGVFKRNYTFRHRAVSGDNGPNTADRTGGFVASQKAAAAALVLLE